MSKYQFGQVVVVDNDQIGVICKTWINPKKGFIYDIYVRSYNGVNEYAEENVHHFIYSKELLDEEKEFYD